MSEKQNVTEGIKKLGDMANQAKESIVSAFKDMNVEVKDWNFAVAKTGNEYNVEVSVKLTIKPKNK